MCSPIPLRPVAILHFRMSSVQSLHTWQASQASRRSTPGSSNTETTQQESSTTTGRPFHLAVSVCINKYVYLCLSLCVDEVCMLGTTVGIGMYACVLSLLCASVHVSVHMWERYKKRGDPWGMWRLIKAVLLRFLLRCFWFPGATGLSEVKF